MLFMARLLSGLPFQSGKETENCQPQSGRAWIWAALISPSVAEKPPSAAEEAELPAAGEAADEVQPLRRRDTTAGTKIMQRKMTRIECFILQSFLNNCPWVSQRPPVWYFGRTPQHTLHYRINIEK